MVLECHCLRSGTIQTLKIKHTQVRSEHSVHSNSSHCQFGPVRARTKSQLSQIRLISSCAIGFAFGFARSALLGQLFQPARSCRRIEAMVAISQHLDPAHGSAKKSVCHAGTYSIPLACARLALFLWGLLFLGLIGVSDLFEHRGDAIAWQ